MKKNELFNQRILRSFAVWNGELENDIIENLLCFSHRTL